MVSRRKLRGMDVFFNDPRTPGVGDEPDPLAAPPAPATVALPEARPNGTSVGPALGALEVAPRSEPAGPADPIAPTAAESAVASNAVGEGTVPEVLVRLDLSLLRFLPEQQPRDMLPAEAWSRLVAAGANTPAGSLEALRAAATPNDGGEPRPASRRVLDHVGELAESIKSDGVLVPLIVLKLGDSHVVLDGHCRAMAAVVAKVGEVPARIQSRQSAGDEADLTDATHRFVLNWTQRRLSPLEAARQVQRIVEIATRVVAAKRGDADGPDTADLTAPADAESAEIARLAADVDLASGELAPGQTRAQESEAAIRRLVLARTGLSLSQYYVLRQLNNLSADAWGPADGLSEGHLRAIVAAPADLHLILVRLVQLAQASVKETKAYARAAREQGEEYLTAKIADLMRRREAPARQRTAVSWEPLLRAVPDDLTPRLSALYAELGALDDERRAVRLRAVARQLPLLEELLHAYREVLDRYGVAPDGAPVLDEALAEKA